MHTNYCGKIHTLLFFAGWQDDQNERRRMMMMFNGCGADCALEVPITIPSPGVAIWSSYAHYTDNLTFLI